MSRLNWGTAGERFYEAGVDQGVLYVDGVGVPWHGLTGVQESPDGGSPKPYYLDGIKYLNVSTAEEFKASIEAYSAPREFDACDGTSSVANGLFVTQQPRKPFGLSYRTLVGNDTDGLDHGYKIHLVYNALAAPTNHQNKSLGETAEPSKLSWDISTTPGVVTGIRPTAHFIVDSRKTPNSLMAILEAVIYGAQGIAPRLPTPAEIVGMFKGWPELGVSVALDFHGTMVPSTQVFVNLATNPSFETVGSTVTVRTNLARNPTPTSITDWYASGGTKVVATFSDGQPCFQSTQTTDTTAYMFSTGGTGTYTPGEVITLSANVEFPELVAGETYTVRAHSQAGNAYYGDGMVVITPVAGVQRIGVTTTVPAGGIPVDDLNLSIVGAIRPVGYRVRMGQVLIERGTKRRSYFDGSSLSTNLSKAPRTIGVGWGNNNAATWDTVKFTTGIPEHPLGITSAIRGNVKAGVASDNKALSINNLDGLAQTKTYATRSYGVWLYSEQPGFEVSPVGGFPRTPLPEKKWIYVKSTTPTYSGQYSGIAVSNPKGVRPTDFVWITGVLTEDHAGPVSDFYDKDRQDHTYGWAGVANSSPSLQLGLGVVALQVSGTAAVAYASKMNPHHGGYFARVYRTGSTGNLTIYPVDSSIAADKVRTGSIWVRPSKATVARVRFGASTSFLPSVSLVANVWQEIRGVDINVGSSTYGLGIVLDLAAGWVEGDYIDLDEHFTVEGSYDGPYFDGNAYKSTYRKQTLKSAWSGNANSSTSTATYYPQLGPDAHSGEAWLIANELWIFNNDSWRNYGKIPITI